MNIKYLINWYELSRVLTGSKNKIRNDVPNKKYDRKIKRLIQVLKAWDNWQRTI